MLEMTLIQKICIYALPVLFAITLHEVAHGWVASKFGDQTARLSGRLTLNPAKHLDVVGSLIVPMVCLLLTSFIFGWAKPVPIDARNMRNPKTDMAIVAAAGPLSNLLMALFWAGIAKLGFFLLPVEGWFAKPLIYMGEAGIMINIVFAVLNFLPIPPLDGGRILQSLLPGRMAWKLQRFEPYGFLVLILLIVSGILSFIMIPLVYFFINLINSLFNLS